jgi:ubiquinone/menaquinone biosynthesis C-methylase UbiE
MKEKSTEHYYNRVAQHFDEDAALFEERYEENAVLQKLRQDFRRRTERYAFHNALEIGCGPGIDMVYFCLHYPDKDFYAFDVSKKMVDIANRNLQHHGLTNGVVRQGSVEDIPQLFPGKKFDLFFVYFGGLNTVYDLKGAVKMLHQVAAPRATFVLTNVNRYYLMDSVFKVLKGKFSESVARFRNRWKGYSPGRDLPSNVYSYRTVKKTFSPEFDIIDKRGYSLFFPPWYGARHLNKIKGVGPALWKLDALLQKTPLWNIGEYTLYIMKAK